SSLSSKGEGGSILKNVNRWRGQVGLPEVTEKELPKVTETFKVGEKGDTAATLVDVTGRGPHLVVRPPVGGEHADKQPAGVTLPFVYETPKGWEKAQGGRLSTLTFRAGTGERAALVTVTRLSGAAGGVLPNVARWGEQIGLKKVPDAELAKLVRDI